MKNNFTLNLTLIIHLLFFSHSISFSQSISASTNPPVYNNGVVQYNVSGSSSGSYDIYTDVKEPVDQTIIDNGNYTGGQISYATTSPGVYFSKLNSNGAFSTAVYDPFSIETTSVEPSDFDSFWAGVVNSLPSPNAQVTSITTSGNVKVADLRLDNINGKKVYCKIAYPSTGSNFPGILYTKAFSSSTNTASTGQIIAMADQINAIVISIAGISEVPVGQSMNPSPFTTEKPLLEDRESYYYKISLAACYQALNYIASRSDYDSSKGIGLFGDSQGAGLSLMLGGIDAENDARVKALMVSHPILCDNRAIILGKAAGYPNYVFFGGEEGLDDNLIYLAARYYDATHAASRITSPVYFEIGYRDFTTHPAGNFAAFNELRGPVQMIHGITEAHHHGHDGFWGGANKIFFQKHLNGNSVTSSNGVIYFVDAGPSTESANQNGTLSLNGTISINTNSQNESTTPAQWSCLDCPANPSFADENDYSTSVTFPAVNGTYTLRFGPVSSTGNSARKFYIDKPGNSDLYYTAADYMIVTVGGGGNPCSNQGGDSDGDGVCNNQDCAPNDPNLPTTVGSSCDDGDSNTTNDVIQSDGCTCAGTPPNGTCSNITVTTSGSNIIVSNLFGDNQIVKIHDQGYNIIDECNSFQGNTCVPSYTYQGSSNTTYIVTVQIFGSTSCNENYTVTTGSGNPCANQGGDSDGDGVCDNQDCAPNDPNLPTTVGSSCDDGDPNTTNDVIQSDGCTCAGTPPSGTCSSITVTTSGSDIIVSNLFGDNQIVKIHDQNYNIITECNSFQGNTCVPSYTYQGSSNTTYIVTVQIFGSTSCNENYTVTTGSGNPCSNQGGDSDGDGVCNNQDCAPNDPNLPTTVGSSCDDGDPNTTNDVIQSDGCTCAGTPPSGTCSSITVTTSGSDVIVSNLFGDNQIVKIHDQNWNLITECNSFNGNNCTPSYTYNGSSNTTYVVTVQIFGSTSCNENYTVTTGSSNYISSNSNEVNVSKENTAFEKVDNQISIYPNPTEDIINITLNKFTGQKGSIEIFNQFGQRQFIKDYSVIPNSPINIDVSKFNSGVYMVLINVGDSYRVAKQFVVIGK